MCSCAQWSSGHCSVQSRAGLPAHDCQREGAIVRMALVEHVTWTLTYAPLPGRWSGGRCWHSQFGAGDRQKQYTWIVAVDAAGWTMYAAESSATVSAEVQRWPTWHDQRRQGGAMPCSARETRACLLILAQMSSGRGAVSISFVASDAGQLGRW